MKILFGFLGGVLTVVLIYIPGFEVFTFLFGASVLFPSFAASTVYYWQRSKTGMRISHWSFGIGSISGGSGAVISNFMMSMETHTFDNVLNRLFNDVFRDANLPLTYALTVASFILLGEIGSSLAWQVRKRTITPGDGGS